MTIAIIGTCPSDQLPQELRVFDDNHHVATFLNSAIVAFEVKGNSSQIGYCQVLLSVSENARCIRQQVRVEFLLSEDGLPLTAVFFGHVDGITRRTKKGGPVTIEFRARGLAASLVDRGFHGEVGPTVDAVVAALAAPAGMRARTDYPDQPLLAWINAESAFAAIRLLGVNLGAIVKTPGEHLELVSYAAFIERLFSPPKFAIKDDDFEVLCVAEGLPFEGIGQS